jgi:hypothetical protein
MDNWYKEVDYNGNGVTKNKIKELEPDIKKAIPLAALAGAALPVAGEFAKPIARKAGEQFAEKGADVPTGVLGTKVHIGPRANKMEMSADDSLKKDNNPGIPPLPMNKSLIKSINSFLMRKGILQKTANKSSMPIGSYQKAEKPVKRLVNSRAVDISPDVWSSGTKSKQTPIG